MREYFVPVAQPALDQGACGGQQFLPSSLQVYLENLGLLTFLYPWSEVQYIYDDFQLISVWYVDLVAQ